MTAKTGQEEKECWDKDSWERTARTAGKVQLGQLGQQSKNMTAREDIAKPGQDRKERIGWPEHGTRIGQFGHDN
jgi:hypothetical protein